MARPLHPYILAEGDRRRRWRGRLRRALIMAAVAVIVMFGTGFWLSRSLPDIVAAEIERLTNTRVQAGTFDFRYDGSISIDGLTIRPHQQEPGYDNAILWARNVYARFSLRSLVLLSPRVTELRLGDFLLNAQLDMKTGRWNLGALRFNRSRGQHVGGAIPEVRLQGGKLRYCKIADGRVEIVMSVPIEARFGMASGRQGYGFEIKTSTLAGGQGESHLSGYWHPGELTVAGGLSSTDLPSLARAWAVDVLAGQLLYDANGDYKLDLRTKGLHGKQAPQVGDLQRLIAATGADNSGPLTSLQRFFDQYGPTGTVGSINVKASGNLRRLQDSEVLGKLVCEDISVCDAKFPYAIDHLAGEIDFTESGVVLKQLSGKHGDVDMQIEGWTKGFGAERQYRYKITSANMILDEALYAALRPGQKRLWDAFHPSGVVAVDYWLVRTSPTDKRMYLSVDLHGVAARFREFPYPLTDLTGKMYFDRDGITATDLVSRSGGRQIRLNAKVSGQVDEKPICYISIDANDIPLDATLENALPSQYRELYGQLEGDGLADVRARVFSTGDANNIGPISYSADVVCHSRSLKVTRFPVALSNVTTEMSVAPDSVNVKSLKGFYGQSRVTLNGGVRLAGKAARQYHATIAAEQLPFDETTVGLLPKSLAEQLAAFRPEGNVNLHVELKTPDANTPPVYAGQVECLGVKINHLRVPYPLRAVHGTISLTPDRLELNDVTAAPADPCQPDGSAAIYIDGSARFVGGAFAQGSFSLKTQDMLFTEGLAGVLPTSLADMYRDLSPQGIFNLDVGKLTISKTAGDDTLVDFEGQADVKVCDVRISGTGTELSGLAKAEGSYSAKEGLRNGRAELAAERLVIQGKTISNMTVDAVYEPNARTWSADGVLGDCYGGKALGNLRVARADSGVLEYMLQVALNRVDLQQFLQAGKPTETQKPYSGGIMNASLSLGGRIGNAASRRGACRVDITAMQVGKVSPLGNLLSVLSLNEPTDYTFERMLIDSYIRQGLLLIRKLDMSGRNVAFTGSGTMTLPGGELNLTLTARGQRVAAAEPSVLQALTEGLGGAVVRMEVTGRASDPHVETKTLPVIEDSLNILGTPE